MAEGCVLITGAAGALGHAVVAHFAAHGAPLALLGRDRAALAKLLAELPGVEGVPVGVDLLDRAAVAAGVEQAVARFGGIHAAIHLAGGFTMGEPAHKTAHSTWQQMFDINVSTMLSSAAAVVPVMQRQKGGYIVNVGAASAQRGAANMAAYIASKSALMRITESMAAELRNEGIHVNAVLPTIIDTPANRAAMPKADYTHWVAPDALADVIGFLASDAARAVYGALIPVTGLS